MGTSSVCITRLGTEVGPGPGCCRAGPIGFSFVDGQHYDLRCRHGGFDLPRGFNGVHLREDNAHDDHAQRRGLDNGDGFLTAGRSPNPEACRQLSHQAFVLTSSGHMNWYRMYTLAPIGLWGQVILVGTALSNNWLTVVFPSRDLSPM